MASKDLRKKLPCTVNILGTPYTVEMRYKKDDPRLTGCGYHNFREKLIVIEPALEKDGFSRTMAFNLEHEELRHEILHAYLMESGLGYDSFNAARWAINEEMIDWFAMQSPKIFKTYKELGVLE